MTKYSDLLKLNIINILLIFSVVGCSSPPPRPSPLVAQMQAADQDARRALKNGELLRAQYNFSKALELQRSLDDVQGAAVTMLNLATVAHQAQQDEIALNWLDKILLEPLHLYSEEIKLNAHYRRAVILTHLAKLAEAEVNLQAADKSCQKTCELRFSIITLKARLSLLKGDAVDALTLAQVVSKETQAGKEEQANAWRVAGAAEERLQRYANAQSSYQAALELDKTLGLSARIAEDLSGLARVATQLGNLQEAAMYVKRAGLVKEAIPFKR